jgi:hypothetical protein
LSEPIGEHPGVQAWLEQRCLELYKSWRGRQEARTGSKKYTAQPAGRFHGPTGQVAIDRSSASDESVRFGGGLIAEIWGADELAQLLAGFGVAPGRVVVKPTWHGYATGTYTDPLALDSLLAAVGPGAVVVEGHTSSRNSVPVDWDWETQAREHRSWIGEQDQLYLEKTGLRQTMSSRGATYLNVTEAYWDERCADPREVTQLLSERGVALRFKELAAYVPSVLFENRGLPLISFARFKGPTRLSISNLFGLLPEPLRAAWHGPNISYFAQVCCDLAKLYGTLFELYGLVESLNVAVRWERGGLYRSRWGNYDLLPRPGVVCLSRGVAVADVLAARLQGQDVRRSAFFDVVQAELGFDSALASAELPAELVRRFV